MDYKPFRASFIAGAIALTGLAPGAFAQQAPGYVTSSSGGVVHSGAGDCVRTSVGTPSTNIAARIACDPATFGGFVPIQIEPAPQAEATPAPSAEPMQRVTLDTDTTFGFDSDQLSERGKEKLNEIVEASKQVENMRVTVTGHTDRIGPEEYNEDLSRRRAEAVKEYLVSEGIPEESITVAAAGEANPVVQCEGMSGNALIECLEPNRRSEVEFAAFIPTDESQESDIMREEEPLPNGALDQPLQ